MTSPDALLLSRIASGDRAAFAEFYDLHASGVFGLLMKLLRRRAEAEDVLQETFLQIWRTARSYDPERASPKVWLFLIARSRATDRLRRRALEDNNPVHEPAEEFDPAEHLARHESAEQVKSALQQLPESQRTAICQAFYGGQSYETVARGQGLPVGTVKTRIRLGLKQLRQLLRQPTEVPGA